MRIDYFIRTPIDYFIYNNCDITFLTVLYPKLGPVNFPCGRKPEDAEKPRTFGRALTNSSHEFVIN